MFVQENSHKNSNLQGNGDWYFCVFRKCVKVKENIQIKS